MYHLPLAISLGDYSGTIAVLMLIAGVVMFTWNWFGQPIVKWFKEVAKDWDEAKDLDPTPHAPVPLEKPLPEPEPIPPAPAQPPVGVIDEEDCDHCDYCEDPCEHEACSPNPGAIMNEQQAFASIKALSSYFRDSGRDKACELLREVGRCLFDDPVETQETDETEPESVSALDEEPNESEDASPSLILSKQQFDKLLSLAAVNESPPKQPVQEQPAPQVPKAPAPRPPAPAAEKPAPAPTPETKPQ